MSHLEDRVLQRCSGMRVIAISLGIAAVGVLPLLLYIAFGPSDGNPIGLGLLAVAAVPIAAMGVFVGLIKLLVQWFAQKGR